MNKLQYSALATNALPYFDKSVNTIRVFVEGPEDIPFWQNLFESILPQNSNYKILCEYKTGCKEVCKEISNLGQEQKIICALDSEYDEIIHDKDCLKNSYTIFTGRHSIENYLFCPQTFNLLIKKLNLDYTQDYLDDCKKYFAELSALLEPLLYLDCKKQEEPELFDIEIKILGSSHSIAKFTHQNNFLPDKEKIKKFIFDNNLQEINTDNLKQKFKDKNLFYFLNGHFIFHSICKYLSVKINRKGCQMNKSNLYGHLYDYCVQCNNKCKDYASIKNSAKAILEQMAI